MSELTRPLAVTPPRIRWRIFSMLVGFGTIVYFQQRSLTVASEQIKQVISLSEMQVGWLQWAFVVSYTALQFPGGVLGQRIGTRRALLGIMLVAVAATALVPLTPLVLSGGALFGALLLTQFVLGAAQGPFMPICAGVMEAWLPSGRWALAQGFHTLACQVGAALAPPVLVVLMAALGWQRALFFAALPPLALCLLWAWYARDTPEQQPAVSVEELAELDAGGGAPPDSSISLGRIRRILTNRDILIVSLSYACMNYVFYLLANWSFIYLIEERHFALLEGGMLAALPPMGAAAGAGVGGVLTDLLCRRFGVRWGYRLVPLFALPAAGLLLLLAVASPSAYAAVAALTAAYAAVEVTEGSYWAGAMRIAQADTMAATGVLNTGGNLGGIIGIPIVAYLAGHQHWAIAFAIGFFCAVLAAAAWLAVDASRPMLAEPTT